MAEQPEKLRPLGLKHRAFVAAYIGEADGNATEAARLAGYAGDANALAVQGWRLLRNAKVAAAVAAEEAKLERRGIAVKQRRLDAKVERHRALDAVRRARSAACAEIAVRNATLPEHRREPLPPGWETGLHVRRVKSLSTGRSVEVVTEFALDATLLREMDALEKDIAQELGEWESKVRHEITVRRLAEEVAAEVGVTVEEAIAEVERILREPRS